MAWVSTRVPLTLAGVGLPRAQVARRSFVTGTRSLHWSPLCPGGGAKGAERRSAEQVVRYPCSYRRLSMTRRNYTTVLTVMVALSIVTFGVYATVRTAAPRAHADQLLPLPLTRQHFNGLDPIFASGDGGPISPGDLKNPPTPLSPPPPPLAATVTTDSWLPPHNPTTPPVNPTSPPYL